MHRLRNRDTAHGDEGDDDSRPRKQRKQRPCYSCAECRRLKMKCDRQVPCSNCVRRHRVDFCIEVTSNTEPSRQNPSRQSEGGQSQFSDSQNPSPPPQSLALEQQPVNADNEQSQGERYQAPLDQQSPPRSQNDQAINLPQPPTASSRYPPSQFNPVSNHPPNPLALLAHALEPYAARGPSPRNPTSESPGSVAEPLYNVPSAVSGSSNPTRQSLDDGQQSGSYGTLMLTKRGQSKYLGPTAGSEWLKASETQDVPDTPVMTRAPSPELRQDSVPVQSSLPHPSTTPIGFPLNASLVHISTRELLACLPLREEAWTLVESYYRYCAWHHDVAPKSSFEKTFARVYDRAERGSPSPPANPQEIALVFIILAQGTMFNIEMPDCDSSAEDFLHLAERALVKGEFLSNNMVAGLQTLHLMAHLHLQLDKDRRGDNAWPLWGLIMRLIQAMGMHRDGDRWNLPQDVTEERRKVFWECNSADIFQAHCFSRPSSLNPEHCDTAFPSEPPGPGGEKNYSILRFELSQISWEILNMAMKVQKPAYSDVSEIDLRLCGFERSIPFYLRCRAALLATPSRYTQVEAAIEASPEPSRRSLAISFQQTNLALNVSETVINLHRPYYAKALYDVDRVESIYRPSFYTVIERCAIIIAIVADIHGRFPAVSTRQWNFWYHVFNSALCLGTLVLRDPGNVMASFVLAQIDAAIGLFTSLLQHGARTPRYKSNLQWLLNLRARARSKISEASAAHKGDTQQATGESDARVNHENRDLEGNGHREQYEDVELLGWRTRLIERAGQGRQKIIRTISLAETPTETPADSHITDFANLPPGDHHQQGQLGGLDMATPGALLPAVTLNSTNDILRDFWDPMLLQDVFGPPHDLVDPSISMVNRTTWWDDIPNASQTRG